MFRMSLRECRFSKEKDNMLSIGGTDFEEGATLEGSMADKEQTIYDAAKYSLDGETALGGSTPFGESTALPGRIEPSEQGLDSSEDISQSPRPPHDDKFDAFWPALWSVVEEELLHCIVMQKKQMHIGLFFVAAAVMGLVLLGQRWQNERWQALQQKWQLSVNDQKTGRMLGPISRLKDVIVGSQSRGSFIRSAPQATLKMMTKNTTGLEGERGGKIHR
ncbi:hypothetical protein GBA52_022805 [Prunus armeniaca]|nr:hypothetical protein GBA52_022805 [Prunus armeniaca]